MKQRVRFHFSSQPSSHFSVLMSCGFAIVINGTACLIIHTEPLFAIVAWNLSSLSFLSFFSFLLLRNFVYMQPGGVMNDSLNSGVWLGLVACLCTLVRHKLLDRRERRRNLSPCLLTQQSIASVERNDELRRRAYGSEHK